MFELSKLSDCPPWNSRRRTRMISVSKQARPRQTRLPLPLVLEIFIICSFAGVLFSRLSQSGALRFADRGPLAPASFHERVLGHDRSRVRAEDMAPDLDPCSRSGCSS